MNETQGSRTPTWVKVFAAVGAVLLVLLVVMLLAGHGPGRHHGMSAPAGRVGAAR